jgi:hypothetical protein
LFFYARDWMGVAKHCIISASIGTAELTECSRIIDGHDPARA